ncbi:hypothetical protein C5167_022742 [Papaver somniferum]|uniref:Uncharacterized protein n=1 Tax=Papaver somniferum TaxID=3469 RepID=A0A4Y7JLU2_PAPSO|nr:hypothetical protein C5167_022742 [Papaver somniferum]
MRKAGADPNGAPDGIKALPLAAGVTQIIKLLVDAGADLDVKNIPIELAAVVGNPQGVEILFPVTSHIPSYDDWSINGTMKHVESKKIAQKKPPGIVIDGLWVYKGWKTIKYDGVAGFTAGVTNTVKNDCSFSVFSNSLTCSADQYALSKYIVGSFMVESQAGKVGMTVESDLKLAQLQHHLPANEPGRLMQLVEGTTGEDNISLSVKFNSYSNCTIVN